MFIILKKCIYNLLLIALFVVLTGTGCTPKDTNRTFAEAHDRFETKLASKKNDQDEIPTPPEGIFDLVYYNSKVGDLAAYVSSNPDDGEKHPMIIWVVGGWGNGIDEFAWSYAPWDNDQSAAAFREEGVLMMYPSFRGGNGNPGYYETLFGEVDDIVSAYEYAASLPYVDAERIYLGGHSTGGTRALLASEYTDKFRAVFCFGPVDEVKYHNVTQFTFDTSSQEEFKMRSPIHWLQDIKSPTFIIEGRDGNASNVENIRNTSKNENISCYIIDDADHFSVLAPITRLLAQKILADTGADSNITLTQEELENVMAQPPVEPMPIMVAVKNEAEGVYLQKPVIWDMTEEPTEDGLMQFYASENYMDDNIWDSSFMYLYVVNDKKDVSLAQFADELGADQDAFQEVEVNGYKTYIIETITTDSLGDEYYLKLIAFPGKERLIEVWLYTPAYFFEDAAPMFEKIIDSIQIER